MNAKQFGNRTSEFGALARRAAFPPRKPRPELLRVPLHSIRKGFTLIELLVVITILGILSSIVFAALARARQRANVLNTKSTITKLHSQIQAKWDSYRTRKVPVNPQQILTTIQTFPATYPVVQTWLNNWKLMPTGANPNNNRQVAAVRLLALRELQRYEMPNGFADFANMGGSPGSYLPRTPDVLTSVPSMALTYLRKLNSANPAATAAQISTFEDAECLYMMVTTGIEDTAFGGELAIPKSVGDADGDGLPEFQDAWPLAEVSFPSVTGPQRGPIVWNRWPAGFRNSGIPGVNAGAAPFVSDLDPDPTLVYPPPPGPGPPYCYTFSIGNHDYFDTLKVDVPQPPAPQAGPPRGYAMTPLVYSYGPDGIAGLNSGNSTSLDPYVLTSGAVLATGGWQDNIHNHLIEAR
jgi:prepilin-type N-terminal cleavage/methylation domain-containing protein